MKSISFVNDGELDLRLLSTFGASIKETNSPIGYFGTGLKYAVAVFMRLGGKVEIFIGSTQYALSCRPEEVRGRTIERIYLNEDPLPFTVELGKNWEAWQAFRELYCNALDEGGNVVLGARSGREHTTTIVVTSEAAVEAYEQRDQIVITREPLFSTEAVDVYEGGSAYVYYRGIRAGQLKTPSLYTYNIRRKMDLTEDRTLSDIHLAEWCIKHAIVQSMNTDFARRIINADDKGTFECVLDYTFTEPSETFLRVLREEAKLPVSKNESLLRLLSRQSGVAYRPTEVKPTKTEKRILEKALRIAERLPLGLRRQEVMIATDLPIEVMGCVYNNEVFISKRAFIEGEDKVIGTVIEELLHKQLHVRDESRAMQNLLLDTMVHLAKKTRRS